MPNYSQQDHLKIQEEAKRLFLEEFGTAHPDYLKERLDRINSVPVDFQTVENFGLYPRLILRLCDFANENQINNQAFLDYEIAIRELAKENFDKTKSFPNQ